MGPKPLLQAQDSKSRCVLPGGHGNVTFSRPCFFPVVLQEEREGKKREKGWLVGVAGWGWFLYVFIL